MKKQLQQQHQKASTDSELSEDKCGKTVKLDTKICLEPSVTDYQTFINTTYKVMGISENKPSREKVKHSVELLLS